MKSDKCWDILGVIAVLSLFFGSLRWGGISIFLLCVVCFVNTGRAAIEGRYLKMLVYLTMLAIFLVSSVFNVWEDAATYF